MDRFSKACLDFGLDQPENTQAMAQVVVLENQLEVVHDVLYLGSTIYAPPSKTGASAKRIVPFPA